MFYLFIYLSTSYVRSSSHILLYSIPYNILRSLVDGVSIFELFTFKVGTRWGILGLTARIHGWPFLIFIYFILLLSLFYYFPFFPVPFPMFEWICVLEYHGDVAFLFLPRVHPTPNAQPGLRPNDRLHHEGSPLSIKDLFL